MNFTVIVIFVTGYLVMFSKKLIVLLMLEGLMVSIIFIHSYMSGFNSACYFFMTLMMIFMVLDSVFSISILIFSSRNSSNMNAVNIYY